MMREIPLYELVGLRKRYNDSFLLNIPHLTIHNGDSIGLSGPNGSGKSTLLRILALLDRSDEGTVFLNGKKITKSDTPLKYCITLLQQDPYLLKRSVFENVAYGLRIRGKGENLKERVYEALRLVGMNPKRFSHRRCSELSGGEARRVALASRLIIKPKVLILDEPTANMDHNSAALIKEAINQIRHKYDTSHIIASHDLVWLSAVTGRILKLYDGQLTGTYADNILSGPWKPDASGLWKKTLPDGQKITSIDPPDENALAILNSSNIVISTELPGHISAQNILRGHIAHMTVEEEAEKVRLEVDVSGTHLICSVTRYAAKVLELLPGKAIWVVFKASSLQWH